MTPAQLDTLLRTHRRAQGGKGAPGARGEAAGSTQRGTVHDLLAFQTMRRA